MNHKTFMPLTANGYDPGWLDNRNKVYRKDPETGEPYLARIEDMEGNILEDYTKEGDIMTKGTPAERPEITELIQVWEESGHSINKVRAHYKTYWQTAKDWLMEAGLITGGQIKKKVETDNVPLPDFEEFLRNLEPKLKEIEPPHSPTNKINPIDCVNISADEITGGVLTSIQVTKLNAQLTVNRLNKLIEELIDQRELTDFNLPEVDWQSKNWTIPGQIKKVLEEAGEVAEAIADNDPENIIREALDVMQTCKTLISMVQVANDMDLDSLYKEHAEKLARKGYLKEEPPC